MSQSATFCLPADDLVSLGSAFNLLGKHRFGTDWSGAMAEAIRLGRCGSTGASQRARGQWALKALVQCVENGWLSLIYFAGDRRVRYFEGSGGLKLHALYPQPNNDDEGQIELAGGDIYPCMVHVGGFGEILRSKFVAPVANRSGPQRRFSELDEALDRYFDDHPLETRECVVHAEIGKLLPDPLLPSRATVYRRIDEAKARARAAIVRTQCETNMR